MNRLYNYTVFAVWLFVSYSLYGQSGHYKSGAVSFSMADASVTNNDSYCLYNNIGGLAGGDNSLDVFFSYQNFYSIPELNTVTAGIRTSVGPIHVSTGFSRFGNEMFNEQTILVGVGHRVRQTSLGISVQYMQYHQEFYKNGRCLTLSFGGLTEINKHVSIGAQIFNLTQSKISSITGERLPTIMNLGIAYWMSSGFKLVLEGEKEIDYHVSVRAGLEYSFKNKFFIRSGVKTQPFASSYGFGLKSGRFSIDYGLQNNNRLGISHQASVVFNLKSNNNAK